MLSCLGAFFCRKIYGGALSDPDGVPPARIAVFGLGRRIDLKHTAEFAVLLLLGIVVLFRH
jgi:hypothetical protein